MSYYEKMTWEEFNKREDLHLIECGETCSHFDSLNQCCWLSWWSKHEGDSCDYDICENEDGIRFVLVTKRRGKEE